MKTLLFGFAASILPLVAAPVTTTVGLVSVDGFNDGSYYIGPYTIAVNGTKAAALCIDFNDDAYIGTYWSANLYTLTILAPHTIPQHRTAPRNTKRQRGWRRESSNLTTMTNASLS